MPLYMISSFSLHIFYTKIKKVYIVSPGALFGGYGLFIPTYSSHSNPIYVKFSMKNRLAGK